MHSCGHVRQLMCNRAAVAKHAELAFGLGLVRDSYMRKAFRKLTTRYLTQYHMESKLCLTYS